MIEVYSVSGAVLGSLEGLGSIGCRLQPSHLPL